MGRSTLFFAGPADDADFIEMVLAENLYCVPHRLDLSFEECRLHPAQYPLLYISLLPRDQLHPYVPKYGPQVPTIHHITDPLLELYRSSIQPPYLVAGRLAWDDDVAAHGAATIETYLKLAKWISRNWMHRDEDDYYIGRDARKCVEEGLTLAYLPPGTPIEIIPVG
jgi:hypothetical protein